MHRSKSKSSLFSLQTRFTVFNLEDFYNMVTTERNPTLHYYCYIKLQSTKNYNCKNSYFKGFLGALYLWDDCETKAIETVYNARPLHLLCCQQVSQPLTAIIGFNVTDDLSLNSSYPDMIIEKKYRAWVFMQTLCQTHSIYDNINQLCE